MKKRRLSIFVLLPLMLGVMASCSKGSDDADSPSGYVSGEKVSMSFMMPVLSTDVLVNSEYADGQSTRFTSTWNNDGKVFMFAKQNGKYINLGRYSIAATNTDNSIFKVEVDASDKLDTKASYQLYGLSGLYNVDNNELFYRVNLARNGGFGLWFSGENGKTKMSNVAGTAEMLFVINKTDKPIKFVHKGYDAEEKWYYTKAEVSVEDGHIQKAEQGTEVVGTAKEIKAYDGKTLPRVISYYVPNGKKIQDAQLIAEIDGKEVRSENRISSDIIPQTNHSYGIFAVWNGERLTLGDGDGEAIIELPEGAGITVNDIKIIGDGDNVNVGTDGSYKAESCNLLAVNKNNRIIYINHTSVSGNPTNNNSNLNARETAISLLLHIFPNILLQEKTDDGFFAIKKLIGELPETISLAAAINKSIVKNGYLEMNDIEVEYETACNKIFEMTGLQKYMDKLSSTRSIHRAAPQSNPSFNGSNSISYQGLKVEMANSQWTQTFAHWLPQAIYVNAWECTLNAYNSNRWAYTSISNAILQDDGSLGFRTSYENSFYEQTAYMLKPQNLSHFMSSTKSWDFLEDTFNLFFKEDFGFDDMTWDNTKLEGVKLYFTTPRDVIYVAAPGDNDNLKLFNLAHLLLSDVMSVLLQDFATVYPEGDKPYTDCLLDFLKKCMTDEKFVIRFLEIEAMTVSDTEKVRLWFALFFDKWIAYLKHDFVEWAKTGAIEWYKEKFRKRAVTDIQNILKSNAFFWEKQIEKWSKPIMLFLGTAYEKSFYINVNLDFHVPSGGLDDVPGNQY